MPYKGLTAVIEALVFSHGFRIFAEKPARGRFGAARKPARGATHIFAETGARIFAEAGARILAEAGARILAEAGAQTSGSAGARTRKPARGDD